MSGPTNFVISYASFLLPLAALEVYFWAGRSKSAGAKISAAALAVIAAVATSIGVFGLAWAGCANESGARVAASPARFRVARRR